LKIFYAAPSPFVRKCLVAATERHLRDAGIEPVTTVIELRDHAQDLSNNLLTGFPSPSLQVAIDQVTDADGVNTLSIVLFTAVPPPPGIPRPNVGCSLIDSARR